MKKVLVTGGAGFVGSHLTEALVRLDYKVRVFDNFSTGKLENLEHVSDKIEIVSGDIRIPDSIDRAMRGIDIVFHQAAAVSVPESFIDPLEFHDICATGTLNVLNAAQANGVERLIYAGSASAYDDIADKAVREVDPLNPQSPYAVAKLAGEHYVRMFAQNSSFEAVVLRYFNIYGSRQDPDSPYAGVISKFANLLRSNEVATIFGRGNQTRDFVHVSDIVRANILASKVENVNGRTFNVGTGISTSILALYESMSTVLKSQLHPLFASGRAGEILHSCANISQATACLGYLPVMSLNHGLIELLFSDVESLGNEANSTVA